MWRVFVSLMVLFSGWCAQGAYWHTDFGEAQRKAYGENRTLLVYFTSSDRGGTCARMQEEIFSKYEFQVFADRHLILVEVDFPRWKKLPAAQIKANRALADKYQGHSWPVVVLMNNQGEAIGRSGYMAGGPEAYNKWIERTAKLTEKPAAPPSDIPLFSGAPIGPPPKYKELTLKSISGAGSKRLALINNVTLAAGESGKVRLGAGEVKIRCEEIREGSAIVTLDGKAARRELLLAPAGDKSAQQARVK